MEHVIALDPGGRSGWASARMDTDRFELTGGGVLRMDFMGKWFAERQLIGSLVHNRGPDARQAPAFNVMVYESWRPRRDDDGRMDWIEGDELVNVQHVGQLRLIAAMSGAKIVTQHPTDKPQALATMPQVLKEMDKYSNEQHDKDARMHLWLYFWREWFTGNRRPEVIV